MPSKKRKHKSKPQKKIGRKPLEIPPEFIPPKPEWVRDPSKKKPGPRRTGGPRWNISDEQRARYNERKEMLRRMRLATETPEEREERLEKRRKLMQRYAERRQETPEERELRLAKVRYAMKRRRMMRKGEGVDVFAGMQDSSSWVGWSEDEAEKARAAEVQRTRDMAFAASKSLKKNSGVHCYFCLEEVDEKAMTTASIKPLLETYGPTVILAETVPTNMCFDCFQQIDTALETYDMVVRTQRYWEAVLQKISLKSAPLSEPKFKVQPPPASSEDYFQPKYEMDSDWESFDDMPASPGGRSTSPDEPLHIYKAPKLEPKEEKVLIEVVHPQTGSMEPEIHHEIYEDNDYIFMCRLCKVGLYDQTQVKTHALLEHKITANRMISGQVVAHRTLKDTDKPYCPKCWKEFNDEVKVHEHQVRCNIPLEQQHFTPGWQRPYKCEKCEKNFTSKAGLHTHHILSCYKSAEEKEKRKVSCPECGKVICNAQVLKTHIEAYHSDNRKMNVCEKCGKRFVVLKSLNLHRLKCDRENPTDPDKPKPFQCTACFKTFSTKYQLQSHVHKNHSQRETFHCRFCNKAFYDETNKIHHEQRIHARANNVACRLCSREFFSLYTLRIHSMNDHNVDPTTPQFNKDVLIRISGEEKERRLRAALEQIQCDQCGAGFPSEAFLKVHRDNNCLPMQEHLGHKENIGSIRYNCEKCNRWFKSNPRLQTHYLKGCEDDDPPLAQIYGKKRLES